MNFENRIRDMIKTSGTSIFMKGLLPTDGKDQYQKNWMVTCGFINTVVIMEQLDINDKTY